MSRRLSILPPSKTVDKQAGKTESSNDITNSDALKEYLMENFIFCTVRNFSFNLFFKSIFRNLVEFCSVFVSCW